MNISYDYLKNQSDMDIYLCTPNEEDLACILATDRVFTACYNDLSTFDMTVYYGEHSETYYDLIESMRLLRVTGIGYFQITSVQENEGEEGKYKKITAESYQTVFKRFGIDIENRVYCLYNVSNPTACLRENPQDDFVPSIVAELHDQIGVALNVQLNDITPSEKYPEWTITYVDEALHYSTGGSGTCRTMDENVEYAYDLLVNKVEESFGCIVSFDYMYKTIKFYSIENVAQKRNAFLSYDNIMKDVEVTEDASDIVTVMRCTGDGIDISLVNPTGSGYITDFWYYMDEVNHKWMSQSLISVLKNWYQDTEEASEDYADIVEDYWDAQNSILDYQTELTNETQFIQDLQLARDEYAKDQINGTSGDSAGMVVVGENVQTGEKSLSSYSNFYNQTFTAARTITAYRDRPAWSSQAGGFIYAAGLDSYTGTAQGAYDGGYKYFLDGDTRSYCELKAKAVVSGGLAIYVVSNFYRYVAYKYVYAFVGLHEKKASSIKSSMAIYQSLADGYVSDLKDISDELNLPNYFHAHDADDEYLELKKYWIEGNYEDASIAALDSTTIPERITLAQELMEIGARELEKVAQPRFHLSITAANCFACPELKDIADTLKLGDVLTVERIPDQLWYYPVLLKITFNFDDPTQIQLDLGNSLRLDDWGFTMADLITNASNTARGVSSNWQELMAFAADRKRIYNLIENPLNAALRAANANMTNQDFTVDTTGILGRVVDGNGEASDEQIRILNNIILFTRDNWANAAAAFGKLEFEDPLNPQSTIEAYGLVADAIIGKLLMSSQLYIANESNTIMLNGAGITIKDSNDTTVFSAGTNGNAYIQGQVLAGSGKIGGWTISSDRLSSTGEDTTNNHTLTVRINAPENATQSSYAIEVLDNSNRMFSVTYGGVMTALSSNVTGDITATGGRVGGWYIGAPFTGSSTGIWKRSGDYIVAMVSGSSASDEAFFVKRTVSNLPVETMFSVNNAGTLVANEAVVKGDITASSFGVPNVLNVDGSTGSCSFLSGVDVYGDLTGHDIYAYCIYGTGEVHTSSSSSQASITVTATKADSLDDEGRVVINYTYADSNWSRTDGEDYPFYIISKKGNTFYSDKVIISLKPSAAGRITSGAYQFRGIELRGLSKNAVTDPSIQPAGTASSISEIVTKDYYPDSLASTALRIGGGCSLIPEMGNVADLGFPNVKWRDVYAGTFHGSLVPPSARMLKNNIKSFDDRHDVMFDKMKPRVFKYNEGTSGRDHYGFIVDEVRDALDAAEMSTNECAAYVLTDVNDPDGDGGLRYEEFVALNTWEIQKLKARIKELENIIKELRL